MIASTSSQRRRVVRSRLLQCNVVEADARCRMVGFEPPARLPCAIGKDTESALLWLGAIPTNTIAHLTEPAWWTDDIKTCFVTTVGNDQMPLYSEQTALYGHARGRSHVDVYCGELYL